jgi:hypothetical protein
MMQLDCQIRLGMIDDMPFILDSWTQQMRHIYPNQYNKDFSISYRNYLRNLISNSTVLVSYLEGEKDQIISYLIYTSFQKQMVIHYAYTKVDARGSGHVHDLIVFGNPLNYPIVFTHPAKNENIMNALCKKHIYDPTLTSLL